MPSRPVPAAAPNSGNAAGIILSFLIALLLFGGLAFAYINWAKTDNPAASSTPKQKVKRADSKTLMTQARQATSEGRHNTAAAKYELAIPALKREGASPEAILECKKNAAKSYYKAKDYQFALDHYSYLAKKDPKLKATLQTIKQEAWASDVKPILARAEQNLSAGNYDRAKRIVGEAKDAANQLGLDTSSINGLESRIKSAHGRADQRVVATRRQKHLDEIITVRITSQFDPMGRPTKMTRREYLRRKKNER